jgi:S-adenosyl-L-methionine hydrolase (adenosine-forming)
MPLLTLLTDFGLADWYVAAVKGVVLGLAPGTGIVDLSHEVPPGDVETAAFLLAAAAPTFPPGTVHLAVVDPGVGSERRLLAVEAGEARFLAPDNGLLTRILQGGGPVAVRAADRPDVYLPSYRPSSGEISGETFHGRDRFAPLAAALLRGEPFASLGPAIADPILLELPRPRREEGLLRGRVAHVDRFGNLVTDLPGAWLPAGTPFAATVGNALTATRRVSCYRDLPPGEPGLLVGSLGTFELSLAGEDLARSRGIARGAPVRIAFGPGARS